MKAFSQDLRKRIVQAVKTTGNQTQVALTFQVSPSTVQRLLKLELVDPELKPQTIPGRTAKVDPQHYSVFTTLLETKNDLTLQRFPNGIEDIALLFQIELLWLSLLISLISCRSCESKSLTLWPR